jgi:hypothetical protein
MDPTLDKWKENTAATYTNLLLVLKKKTKKSIIFPGLFSKHKSTAGIRRYKILKVPKHEIFGFRVFMQSKPVRVGDLETRPKNQNFDG